MRLTARGQGPFSLGPIFTKPRRAGHFTTKAQVLVPSRGLGYIRVSGFQFERAADGEEERLRRVLPELEPGPARPAVEVLDGVGQPADGAALRHCCSVSRAARALPA